MRLALQGIDGVYMKCARCSVGNTSAMAHGACLPCISYAGPDKGPQESQQGGFAGQVLSTARESQQSRRGCSA